MSKPKAYCPEEGYKYQLLLKCPGEREYEHLDYAVDAKDKKHLLDNYRLVYGHGYFINTYMFPPKYWPKVAPKTNQ